MQAAHALCNFQTGVFLVVHMLFLCVNMSCLMPHGYSLKESYAYCWSCSFVQGFDFPDPKQAKEAVQQPKKLFQSGSQPQKQVCSTDC